MKEKNSYQNKLITHLELLENPNFNIISFLKCTHAKCHLRWVADKAVFEHLKHANPAVVFLKN